MIDRIRNRGQFHPDLRLASLVLPRRMVSRRTLSVVRKASGLIPGARGAEVHELGPGAAVRVFRPSGPQSSPTPGFLWIHGGGYVIGTAAQDDALCRAFAERTGATVASVDYRLAPDFPFPAPLDDCHAGLKWLAAQPDIDSTKIAIGGASAGAGLAAALAIRARDHGPINPILQVLAYPMIDDRSATGDNRHRLWDAKSNRFGWQSYLGESDPAVVAPAHNPDLAGLAPAWIGVGTLDLFFDEDKAYAERLEAAGVACEFLTVPGAFHGFDLIVRRAAVTKSFFTAQCEALRAAFAG